MQHLLGYSEWRNFLLVVNKAKAACEVSGHAVDNHFVGVNKMVELVKGATPEISAEHITNNKAVRDTLLKRGIRLVPLPPEEDIKKVERGIASQDKKASENLIF